MHRKRYTRQASTTGRHNNWVVGVAAACGWQWSCRVQSGGRSGGHRTGAVTPRFTHSGSLDPSKQTNFNLPMTITKATSNVLFELGPTSQPQLIRMAQRFTGDKRSSKRKASLVGWWTTEEHDKFLEAMEIYPSGPWKKIAHHVGSRTPRQVMTHAQKYRQRIKRRGNLKQRSKTSNVTSPAQTVSSVDKSTSGMSEAVAGVVPLATTSSSESGAKEILLCEMQDQFADEFSALDLLLLDEVIQHNNPSTIAVPSSPRGYMNDAELEVFLSNSSIDWVALDLSLGVGMHSQ